MLKETLLTYAVKIRDEPCEHAYVFDVAGHVLTELAGGRSQITFGHHDLFTLGGTVFLHNHPCGGSFSLADIWTACALGMRGMVVVTRESVSCLSPPDGDDVFCRRHYGDIVRCYRFRTLGADLSARLTCSGTVWEEVAHDLGLGYCTISFPDRPADTAEKTVRSCTEGNGGVVPGA